MIGWEREGGEHKGISRGDKDKAVAALSSCSSNSAAILLPEVASDKAEMRKVISSGEDHSSQNSQAAWQWLGYQSAASIFLMPSGPKLTLRGRGLVISQRQNRQVFGEADFPILLIT